MRFDGGHKKDTFLTEVLAPHVEWVAVCPEVEVGMGTPRETLRLVREDGRVRMVTTRSAKDYTDAMNAWSRKRVEALATEDLDGYVLKKDSPSCGMERVKVLRQRRARCSGRPRTFCRHADRSGAITAGRGGGTPLRSATS